MSVTETQPQFGLVRLITKSNPPPGLQRGERNGLPSEPFPEAGAESSEELSGILSD